MCDITVLWSEQFGTAFSYLKLQFFYFNASENRDIAISASKIDNRILHS